MKFGSLSSGSDSFRVSHHCIFATIYVFENKQRQRNTSGRYHFTDSWKTDIVVPHVKQHLLFCCSCWIGCPFIWTILEGFLSRAAWLPALLQMRQGIFQLDQDNPFEWNQKTTLPYLFLIAADIAKNASSTLIDSLALVSRNGMPISSA